MMIRIKRENNSLSEGLRSFFTKILGLNEIDALFLPLEVYGSDSAMPALLTDPEQLEHALPFSPAFPVNSARMVSRLSFRQSGRKTAVLLRPCEIRAFIELVKLKQGSRQELVIIGMDCPGALTWADYRAYVQNGALSSDEFIENVFSGTCTNIKGFEFSRACTCCEHPFAVNADINIMGFGVDLSEGMIADSCTDRGKKLLESLGMPEASEPLKREEIMETIKNEKSRAAEAMILDIDQRTGSIEKLAGFFDMCINCYNCRNMCPVCYCKECVFNTDVFIHKPFQYHQWAEKKGSIKMPTDTVFYHLTRMAHMSLACVGCGQCSNACPSGMPVYEVFRSVSSVSQAAFAYHPGMDEDAPPPLSVFNEKEFEEIVGIGDN